MALPAGTTSFTICVTAAFPDMAEKGEVRNGVGRVEWAFFSSSSSVTCLSSPLLSCRAPVVDVPTFLLSSRLLLLKQRRRDARRRQLRLLQRNVGGGRT